MARHEVHWDDEANRRHWFTHRLEAGAMFRVSSARWAASSMLLTMQHEYCKNLKDDLLETHVEEHLHAVRLLHFLSLETRQNSSTESEIIFYHVCVWLVSPRDVPWPQGHDPEKQRVMSPRDEKNVEFMSNVICIKRQVRIQLPPTQYRILGHARRCKKCTQALYRCLLVSRNPVLARSRRTRIEGLTYADFVNVGARI